MTRLPSGFVVAVALAGSPALPAADAETLAGVWLADAADSHMDRALSRVWFSKFTIDKNTFRISRVMTHPKDLTGTFTLDPTTTPRSIDLKVDEFDFGAIGMPVKVPAVTLPGIYKLDGDRLTVCFHLDPDRKRPTEFAAKHKTAVVLTLGRAAAGFQDHPREVTVTVRDPDGKLVPNATTFAFMSLPGPGDRKGGPREWQYAHAFPTGPDGTATVPYAEIEQGVFARAADRKLIGFAPASPFSLQTPALTVTLGPEVRLTGTVASEDLKAAGQPFTGANTYLLHRGRRIGFCPALDGKFEYVAAAGEYAVNAYGSDLEGKTVPVTVPPGRAEFEVPPINLKASALALIKGKPAPELADVVGWKGDSFTLAGLKGKYVLLEFWGYWCGPCVHAMPVLFELHDRFKDRGLAVVGVHLDIDGEVDTTAKLDARLVSIRKELWKGRDLPFPVALTSGKEVDVGGGEMRRGGPVFQYGIQSYPTTVLIDREGKVVGRFHARNAESAVREVEALLAKADDPPGRPTPPVQLTAQEDHRRLMGLLSIKQLRPGANPRDPNAPNAVNYDEAKATPYPNLPDPLVLKNGRKVTTPEEWWNRRRPEIVEDFDREVYGRVPKVTPKVKWEVTATGEQTVGDIPAVTKRLVGRVDNSAYPHVAVDIQLTLTTPKDAKGPVPVILEFGFGFGGKGPGKFPPAGKGPGWQPQVLRKGWGYAILVPTSVQADTGGMTGKDGVYRGLTTGIIGLCNRGQPRQPDDWGALRAWAWGASRALDYFETDKAVDAKRVGIEGLSRYGKAAAVALAYDRRFAIGFIGSSGAGGLKLHRRDFGERVENVAAAGEYHWVAGNYLKYAGPLTPNDLPVDAHHLVALCAPRPVFISVGSERVEGGWVDARGMFLAGVGAGPVYELLGKKGLGTTAFPPQETALTDGEIAFRQHAGGHTTGPNWPTFLNWADRYLGAGK